MKERGKEKSAMLQLDNPETTDGEHDPVGSNYSAQLQMPRRTRLAAPRPSARSGA